MGPIETSIHQSHEERRRRLMGQPPVKPPPKMKEPKVCKAEARADLGKSFLAIFPVQTAFPESTQVVPDLPAADTKPIFKIGKFRTGKPSVMEIQVITAKYYGVSRRDILSGRRTADIIRPRHMAMLFCKTLTPLSLPSIGRLFGGRDHTTILSGVSKSERKMHDGDPLVWYEASAITDLLADIGADVSGMEELFSRAALSHVQQEGLSS